MQLVNYLLSELLTTIRSFGFACTRTQSAKWINLLMSMTETYWSNRSVQYDSLLKLYWLFLLHMSEVHRIYPWGTGGLSIIGFPGKTISALLKLLANQTGNQVNSLKLCIIGFNFLKKREEGCYWFPSTLPSSSGSVGSLERGR